MRYGVIADIHGNLDALRAVLDALEREGVDGHLVAGDLVGYGPHPNECIALVAGLSAVSVVGNHDLIAIGRLSDERSIPLARQSLLWTAHVLSRDSRAFLEALPLRATAPGGVTLAHGALDDPQEYTIDRRQAVAQLAEIARAGQRVLVLGHTHLAWAFASAGGTRRARDTVSLPSGEPLLLNPGAVGQSRELRARARYAVLDLDAERVSFEALRYDTHACRAALVAAGLPPRSCHLRPPVPRALARAVRRRVRA